MIGVARRSSLGRMTDRHAMTTADAAWLGMDRPTNLKEMADERLRHRAFTRATGDDPPEIRDWAW
jgi:phosphoketolase